jgi:hypothetical protein
MTKLLLLLLGLASIGAPVVGPAAPPPVRQQPVPQQPLPRQPAATFAAYDVFVDSGGRALGAFQFEWRVLQGRAGVVGVEGGEGVFAEAPYYDAAALQGGRIVVAAFSTRQELPQGRTRVARVHLRIEGGAAPQFAVRLEACADGEGAALAAAVDFRKVEIR